MSPGEEDFVNLRPKRGSAPVNWSHSAIIPSQRCGCSTINSCLLLELSAGIPLAAGALLERKYSRD
jgi:hypothetical protein